jgi:hypothetical protein
LAHVEKRLLEENERVLHYLDSGTRFEFIANFYFYSQIRCAVSYLHVNNLTYILQVDLDSYRRKTVDFGAFGEHPVQRPGKLAG